jgi:hypothetical protein
MSKNDVELSLIVEDTILFLKERESLAAITNTKNLHNAS